MLLGFILRTRWVTFLTTPGLATVVDPYRNQSGATGALWISSCSSMPLVF